MTRIKQDRRGSSRHGEERRKMFIEDWDSSGFYNPLPTEETAAQYRNNSEGSRQTSHGTLAAAAASILCPTVG